MWVKGHAGCRICSSSARLGRNPEPDPRPGNTGRQKRWGQDPGDPGPFGHSGPFGHKYRDETGLNSVFCKSEGLKSENQSSVTLCTDQELIAITASLLLNTTGCISAAAGTALQSAEGALAPPHPIPAWHSQSPKVQSHPSRGPTRPPSLI